MNRRPIGLDHGEHCDSGDWEFMCDECRDDSYFYEGEIESEADR